MMGVEPGRILSSPRRSQAVVAVMIGAYLLLTAFLGLYLPVGIDWHQTFRPAALGLWTGQSPYNNPQILSPFANAPWILLPLAPLALLPESIGRGLFFGLSLLAFLAAAMRLGGKIPAVAAFLLSPPVMHCLLNANLDWAPVLGFALAPRWGLFLLAVKPQMGSVVAVFWLVEAWRSGGWREVVHVFWPVSLALLASLAIFGLWPLNMLAVDSYTTFWNASLWPMSIPVGLALAVAALRKRRAEYAMAASPCLSPYVLFHSWSAALIAIIRLNAETVVAVIGLWLLVIVRAITLGG